MKYMWKRIQNIYLAVSIGLIISLFFCNVGTVTGATGHNAVVKYTDVTTYMIMIIMVLVANIFAIFSRMKPLLQSRICVIAGLLTVGLQIWLGVDFFKYKEGMVFSVTILFPLLSSFLNFMAARNAMIDGLTVQTIRKKKGGSSKGIQ